jgi:hypothetical protein
MMKKHLLLLLAVPLCGCNSNTVSTRLKFVIAPDEANHSLQLDCKESSSESCHFAFTEGVSPSVVDLKVGSTMVLHGDIDNVLYCAEINRPAIETCSKSSIAPKRRVITKRSSTDESL